MRPSSLPYCLWLSSTEVAALLQPAAAGHAAQIPAGRSHVSPVPYLFLFVSHLFRHRPVLSQLRAGCSMSMEPVG